MRGLVKRGAAELFGSGWGFTTFAPAGPLGAVAIALVPLAVRMGRRTRSASSPTAGVAASVPADA